MDICRKFNYKIIMIITLVVILGGLLDISIGNMLVVIQEIVQ